MRQDPPFDMAYITATHLLEHIHPKTLVVNDPAAVRNAPEKLLVTHFPDLMPPTMITWDLEAIRTSASNTRTSSSSRCSATAAPACSASSRTMRTLPSLLEMHFARSREPLMFQRYEPAVRQGDKRIILVDGEPVGVVNRVPAAGEARSNMHVGGRPEKCTLSARDREICAAIGPTLREQGMIFVGIDVIGDWLDRDQRHLAHRHPGDRPLRRHQYRRTDLGPHRGETRRLMVNHRQLRRHSCARWRWR